MEDRYIYLPQLKPWAWGPCKKSVGEWRRKQLPDWGPNPMGWFIKSGPLVWLWPHIYYIPVSLVQVSGPTRVQSFLAGTSYDPKVYSNSFMTPHVWHLWVDVDFFFFSFPPFSSFIHNLLRTWSQMNTFYSTKSNFGLIFCKRF